MRTNDSTNVVILDLNEQADASQVIADALRVVEPIPSAYSGDSPWEIEQRKHEVNRLQRILRNPSATSEELRIARDMLRGYTL